MADKDKVKLTCWEKTDQQCRAFANFFYNKQTGQVMGRSNSSWAKIGLFYFVYYGFLACCFSGFLAIFLSTLNEPGKGGPKTTQFLRDNSAPGLNVVASFKSYKKNNDRIGEIQSQLKNYLDGFDNANYGSPCVVGSTTVGNKPCKFNRTMLGNCSGLVNQDFGFADNKMCVFVKINKVYDWIPKNGNSAYLKLDCSGEGGKVTVVPEGYLISAFPFRGESYYQTPPVAVIVEGTKVKVSCKLQGQGFTVSESYVASRAFGKIRFEVEP